MTPPLKQICRERPKEEEEKSREIDDRPKARIFPNIVTSKYWVNLTLQGEGRNLPPFSFPSPLGRERRGQPTDLPTKKLILESNLWMEGGKGSKVGKVVLPAGYDFLLFPHRQIDGGANTLFLY